MLGKDSLVNFSLSQYLGDAFGGVIELQLEGLPASIIDFNFLSGLPAAKEIAPGQIVEFLDVAAHTYF